LAFLVSGGIGLLRFPDFYSRLHAASITDTAGAGAVLIALMLSAGLSLTLVKLIFILILIAITSPTATHALAKAAVYDDLKPFARQSAQSTTNVGSPTADADD
jgi:multicomponent Na+:H+ antiporter subunit G